MKRLVQFALGLSLLLIVGCGTRAKITETARTSAAVPANKMQTASNDAAIPPNVYIMPPNVYLLPNGEPVPPAEAPPPVAQTQQQQPPAAGSQQPDDGSKHWLTSSSGKRHNSSCQYFGTSKGAPCGPDDGSPCLKCGG